MGRVYKQKASDFYYADYTDENGDRVRKSTKCKTLRKAKETLAVWENTARELRLGVRSPVVRHQIEASLDEWELGSQSSARHVAYTRKQIERICDAAEWTNLCDISADGIEAYVAAMDATNRTKQSHITAIRTFCRWCVKRGKLPSDPTATIDKPTPEKSSRRMLEKSEWVKLRAYLSKADRTINRQQASDRLILYWTAIETGLRSAELRSLTKGDLVLGGKSPHISLDGSRTKNGKPAKQFISDKLARKLKAYTKQLGESDPVFMVSDPTKMAEVFRDDCVKAGLENTEVLDFHCLRHTTGSWLAAAGVPLNQVQGIMRHSSIVLTLDRYGHISNDDQGSNRQILGKLLT